jgi:hypothetical protein
VQAGGQVRDEIMSSRDEDIPAIKGRGGEAAAKQNRAVEEERVVLMETKSDEEMISESHLCLLDNFFLWV